MMAHCRDIEGWATTETLTRLLINRLSTQSDIAARLLPNKILQTTIVAFEAILNVSIYIQIMDINATENATENRG